MAATKEEKDKAEVVRLTWQQKLMGIILAFGASALTAGAGYVANRATSDYRIQETSQHVDDHETRIKHIENQNYDLRIPQMEAKINDQQQTLEDIKVTMERVKTLLEVIEKNKDSSKK